MLLLKLTLVVLILVIGERGLCTDSDSAPTAKENKNAREALPQESLINNTDSKGCFFQVLPYYESETDFGVLTVNCEKLCPKGIHGTEVNGNPCVASWNYLDSRASIEVQEGLCDHGSCNPRHPPKNHIISLGEEEEEGEEKEDEEEEKKKKKKEKNNKNKKNP
uniref:Putative evasin n=1 Tax=Ixodes ricinus TaxID=34613 RepID=A0A6B0UZ11_IXORI